MFSPSQKGDEQDSASRCGRKYDELLHQVDAQLVVLQADVHVHAADDHAARGRLHLAGQRDVAVLVGVLLLDGARERMGRCGDGRDAVLAPDVDDDLAQAREMRARLVHVAAHAACRLRSASAGTPG